MGKSGERIWMMEEIWRSPVDSYIVYPIICRVSYILGGVGFLPSTVRMMLMENLANQLSLVVLIRAFWKWFFHTS